MICFLRVSYTNSFGAPLVGVFGEGEAIATGAGVAGEGEAADMGAGGGADVELATGEGVDVAGFPLVVVCWQPEKMTRTRTRTMAITQYLMIFPPRFVLLLFVS